MLKDLTLQTRRHVLQPSTLVTARAFCANIPRYDSIWECYPEQFYGAFLKKQIYKVVTDVGAIFLCLYERPESSD